MLEGTPITYKFGNDKCRAFVELKCILTTEPVLKSPVYDGKMFVITTDGAKLGSGAVLAQWFEFLKKDGLVVKCLHLVAFGSKCTSAAKERYKPSLLEFAALKFAIDKFGSIIAGHDSEIKTDCQALSDFLQNNKLQAHHARWKEAVVSQRIVVIWHQPGVTNKVADGLSWKWSDHNRQCHDGEDWSIDPGWEASKGIMNDVFALGVQQEVGLHTCFVKNSYFSEVVEWLEGGQLATTSDNTSQRRARRRAADFLIEDGKLWRVARGRQAWRILRVECVPT